MTAIGVLLRTSALLSFGAAVASASIISPIWADPGTLKIADSSGLTAASPTTYTYETGLVKNVTLDTSFHLFGVNYSSVTVSSTGYLAFTGNQTAPDAVANDASMAHSNVVRISPAWWDLEAIDDNPTDTLAGIYLNQNTPGQTVITWENMAYQTLPGSYPDSLALSTFQVILNSDGSIVFGYRELNVLKPLVGGDNSLSGANQVLIGIANNNGSAPMNTAALAQVALGTASSFQTCDTTHCFDTVYQSILNPEANAGAAGVELSGGNVVFRPGTQGGWNVSSASSPFAVAPEPATLLQFLAAATACVILRSKVTRS